MEEVKVWWKSKTILLILVAVIATSLEKFGVLGSLTTADHAVIVDLILNGTTYGSLLLAAISRLIATKKVVITTPPVVGELPPGIDRPL